MKITVCKCPTCRKRISLKTISSAEADEIKMRALIEGAGKKFFENQADEMREIARKHSRPIRTDRDGFPLPSENLAFSPQPLAFSSEVAA